MIAQPPKPLYRRPMSFDAPPQAQDVFNDLRTTLEAIEQELRAAETARPDEDDFAASHRWRQERLKLAPHLLELIERTGLIGPSAPLIHAGAGGCNLTPWELPDRLFDLTAWRGAAPAAEALRFLACAETAVMTTTWLLWGLRLETSQTILPQIELAPAASPSAADIYKRSFEAMPWHLQIDQPMTSLKVQYTIPRVRFREGDLTAEELNSESSAVYRLGREVVDALVTCGPNPVLIERSWTTYSDPDVAHLLGGRPRSVGHGEFMPWRLEAAPVSPAAAAAVRNILSSETSKKDRLTLAARRLNGALLRIHEGDAAVDVAIALEAVFWAAGDGGTKTRNIVQQRARWLLGREHDGKKVSRTLEDLFILRNAVVHGERAASACSDVEREIVQSSLRLCAAAIRSVAARPGWPDWRHAPPPHARG